MSLDFQRLEQVLAEAAARADPVERAAFLSRACGTDRALRTEVERLLAANAKAGDFLETPAAVSGQNLAYKGPNPEGGAPSGASGQDIVLDVEPTEKPGTQIGRYKLLEEIGEGAFGVVYMAEQLEPVQRKVALKIIKAGMDTREVVARFEAERQALALMDHPSIAQVFDGGVTQAGRPYFVMELVRGIPITAFCDQRNLTTSERLQLFIQVCHAVQHAHQKGIIHRDLKPSNILVTLIDGQPVPKVIDFGVAKALGRRLTDKTLFTGFLRMVGTPAYMSPEQADLSGVDIDTRSDIYALGVLLYELLTGVTPFDPETLRNAALNEIGRLIREIEPPKPSTRLQTLVAADVRRLKSSTAESATEEEVRASSRRLLQTRERIRLVRGDLDWIVMKCIEKDRKRRYETADALVADVQRHLQNEPITARPRSKLYRLHKLVQRNKLAFAAGGAVTLSLVIGLTVATMMFFREREQAAIAQAVNDFLQNDLLRQADSRVQADTQFKADPNLTVREALERASQRIGERFKDQPTTELAIRLAVGDALRGIGREAQAVPHLVRAMELSQAKLGPEHPVTLKCMDKLGAAYTLAGSLDRAVPLLERTLNLRQARLGAKHLDTITTMLNLGAAYATAGKVDQAIPLLEEALKLRQARLGPDHPDTLKAMAQLGEACYYADRIFRAQQLFEETLKLRKAKLGPDHPDTVLSMNHLAAAYGAAGKREEALRLHEEVLNFRLAIFGPDHPDTLSSKHNLGGSYLESGKLEEAVLLLEEVVKKRKVSLGLDHPITLLSTHWLIKAYQAVGRLGEALPLGEEAVRLAKNKLGLDHWITLRLMNDLACSYQQAGRLDQALPLLEQTVTLAKAKIPGQEYTLTAMNDLALAYQQVGKPDQALALFEETLNSRRAILGPEHPDTLLTLADLSKCLLQRASYTNAEALARDCLQLRQKAAPKDWRTFAVQTTLGLALLGQNKYADAEPFLLQGYAGLKERERGIPANSRGQVREAAQDLVQLYDSWGKPDDSARWRRELERISRSATAEAKTPAASP